MCVAALNFDWKKPTAPLQLRNGSLLLTSDLWSLPATPSRHVVAWRRWKPRLRRDIWQSPSPNCPENANASRLASDVWRLTSDGLRLMLLAIDDEPRPRLTQRESPQRFKLLCPVDQWWFWFGGYDAGVTEIAGFNPEIIGVVHRQAI
jgi:hypothetical protein